VAEAARRVGVNPFGPAAEKRREFDPTDATEEDRVRVFGEATFGSRYANWRACLVHPKSDVLIIPAAGYTYLYAGAVPVSQKAIAYFLAHRGAFGYVDDLGSGRRVLPCFTLSAEALKANYDGRGLVAEIAGPEVAKLFRDPRGGIHPVEPSEAGSMIG
jgi:hypothetical protein